ncbi:MAG: class II glutamine amidotransferase, partial [Alicyclobacillus sp.]|nr:class II glutamine amidotransferase [Alicyclobacillus sp.]
MPFREQEAFAVWPDKPREECGVFGIFGHPRAAEVAYYGLLALQHRGQEAAGMAVSDGQHLRSHKGLGLLADVFSDAQLADLPGTAAIGHVRYSTAGANTLANAQPLSASTYRGPLALAHNGNLVNAQALRTWLERQGSLFQSTSDTEVVLHLVARAGRESLLE